MGYVSSIIGPDNTKIVLFEVRVGKEIEALTWTATGAGSHWAPFLIATNGEIVAVSENGTALTSRASVALCDANASSFFVDLTNQRIYIHTSTGAAPDNKTGGVYDFCLIAYFWLCFCDDSPTATPAAFIPAGATLTVPYMPFLDAASIGDVKMAGGDYIGGDYQVQLGSIQFTNDGWWYDALVNFLWHNQQARLKIGAAGAAYANFDTFYIGTTQTPVISDEGVTIGMVDPKVGALEIPLRQYTTALYANLDPDAVGRPIPILIGEKTNITPVCISTVLWVYKIADHNYQACQSLDAVYKDGVALATPADYSPNADKTEFTLTADPGDSLITCDAKGAKIQVDFTATPPAYAAGPVYSENIADVLFFILVTLNGISASLIDKASFLDLQTNCTAHVAWYMDAAGPTADFIRMLQATGMFLYIPKLDGTHAARRYTNTMAGTEPAFYTDDCGGFELRYETTQARKFVTVSYGKDPSAGTWLSTMQTEAKAGYRYECKEGTPIETALRLAAEAVTLANAYLGFISQPQQIASGRFLPTALGMIPGDKFTFYRQITGADGVAVTVLNSMALRIIEINKNVQTGQCGIVATRVWV